MDKCPELTDYEKDLIIRIDIKGETQASVAKFYEKSPAHDQHSAQKNIRKVHFMAQRQQGIRENPG